LEILVNSAGTAIEILDNNITNSAEAGARRNADVVAQVVKALEYPQAHAGLNSLGSVFQCFVATGGDRSSLIVDVISCKRGRRNQSGNRHSEAAKCAPSGQQIGLHRYIDLKGGVGFQRTSAPLAEGREMFPLRQAQSSKQFGGITSERAGELGAPGKVHSVSKPVFRIIDVAPRLALLPISTSPQQARERPSLASLLTFYSSTLSEPQCFRSAKWSSSQCPCCDKADRAGI
jgi:hypothetical protein